MEKPTAKVRLGDDGAVSIEVDISPDADPEDLVTSQQEADEPDADVLGQIKGSRGPRWVELAGGA
jgi:hypothetical protein